MSEIEIIHIVKNVLRTGVINDLVDRSPKSSTKQACKFLGCSKQWLLNNRTLFKSCRVRDMRGSLEFDTYELVEYKMRFLK